MEYPDDFGLVSFLPPQAVGENPDKGKGDSQEGKTEKGGGGVRVVAPALANICQHCVCLSETALCASC